MTWFTRHFLFLPAKKEIINRKSEVFKIGERWISNHSILLSVSDGHKIEMSMNDCIGPRNIHSHHLDFFCRCENDKNLYPDGGCGYGEFTSRTFTLEELIQLYEAIGKVIKYVKGED